MAISKITTSGVATDTLTAADLAPNSVDSSELVDGSVDLSHMSANSVDSDQYVDVSIDTAHIGDDQVTGAKIENNPTIAGNLTVSGDLVPSTPLSHRNMIINGDMSINQRGNLANTSAVGYNALDRWKWDYHTGLGTVDHTTGTKDEHGAGPVGFAYSYRIAIDSNSGTGTGTYAHLEQRIEGNNCKRLLTNASAGVGLNLFTLSFYVKTPTTGTYSVAISQPQNSNRIYTTSYTVTDTNWNRYEITIPADTAGVVNLDNSTGLIISWTVGGISSSGSTVGGAGVASWGAYDATKRSMSGQANLFAGTIGDAFYLTGVQLELGSNATPFEHRSYGDELERCQRYFQKISYHQGWGTGIGKVRGSGQAFTVLNFLVTMRGVPGTVTIPTVGQATGNITYLNGETYPSTHGSLSATEASTDSCFLNFTGFSNIGNNQDATWAYVAGGPVDFKFDAEI